MSLVNIRAISVCLVRMPTFSLPVAGEPGGAEPSRDAGGPGRADCGPEPAGGVQVRRLGAPGQGHQLVQGRSPAAPGKQVRQTGRN